MLCFAILFSGHVGWANECFWAMHTPAQQIAIARESFERVEAALTSLNAKEVETFVFENRSSIYELAVRECGPAAVCDVDQFSAVLSQLIIHNYGQMEKGGKNFLSAPQRILDIISFYKIAARLKRGWALVPAVYIFCSLHLLNIATKLLLYDFNAVMNVSALGGSFAGAAVVTGLLSFGFQTLYAVTHSAKALNQVRHIHQGTDELIRLESFRDETTFNRFLKEIERSQMSPSKMADLLVKRYYQYYQLSRLEDLFPEMTKFVDKTQIEADDQMLKDQIFRLDHEKRMKILQSIESDVFRIRDFRDPEFSENRWANGEMQSYFKTVLGL